MLYLTVETPVSLSLWNDTWKDNMNTNKEFQEISSLKNENSDQEGI